jgi:Zn-dependent alcohol dehydrogenase
MKKLLVLLLLTGCGTLRLRPVNLDHRARKLEVTQTLSTDEERLNTALKAEQSECDSLDNKVMGWTATTIVAGVLGGAGGVTSLLTDNTPRTVTGSVGVGLAAISALSAYLSTQYAQRYSHRCTVNTGGK